MSTPNERLEDPARLLQRFPQSSTETWPEIPNLQLQLRTNASGYNGDGAEQAIDRVLFLRILEVIPAPTLVCDADGSIAFATPELFQLFGYSSDELLGRPVWLLVSEQQRIAYSAGLKQFFANPRAISLTRRTTPLLFGRRKDGSELNVDVEVRPLMLEGRRFAIAAITDRSECHEKERALREGEYRLKSIMDNASSVIYVKNLDGRYLLVNRQFERLFDIAQNKVAGKTDYDIFPEELAAAFRRNDDHVAATDSEITIEEIAPHADGPHTYISVKFPLHDNRGQLYAVAGISTDITDRIERLRMEQELLSARTVQQLLYPTEAVMFPGLDLAGTANAAKQACGDYFDFIPLSDSRLAAVVGDVSGHGLGPALEMVETRAYLRAILENSDLDRAIDRLNQILCKDLPSEAFVTLFLAVVDVSARTLTYAGAGHEALLVRASGETVRLRSTGMLLGMLPDLPIHTAPQYSFEPGDLLLLTTDGVVETMSPQGELFGWERLMQLAGRHRLIPASEIVRTIHQSVTEFAGARARTDDSTVVAVKLL